MASNRRFGRFTLLFAGILLAVTGFAGASHAKGQIVGQHTIALDILMPKDKAAFKVGESVHFTVRSSGFTGVKTAVKNTATGAQEELQAAFVKSEGTGALAPKIWDAMWSTTGKKPGTYIFTVTGTSGSQASPTTKSVTVSVVQPTGPAKITFREPAGGRQVKAGETVNVAVTASGVSKVEFFIRDLQTGTEKPRSSAHKVGSDEYTTTWLSEGLAKGSYQIIARGFGPDGKKLAEESVTMTITGGAPPLKR